MRPAATRPPARLGHFSRRIPHDQLRPSAIDSAPSLLGGGPEMLRPSIYTGEIHFACRFMYIAVTRHIPASYPPEPDTSHLRAARVVPTRSRGPVCGPMIHLSTVIRFTDYATFDHRSQRWQTSPQTHSARPPLYCHDLQTIASCGQFGRGSRAAQEGLTCSACRIYPRGVLRLIIDLLFLPAYGIMLRDMQTAPTNTVQTPRHL
ncbi:hypothetical protein C2E23DRAFT_822398 [Lenzites betulinus]|nr:hypothetical protein C2E23DRAFT_822398 [Lenzites betulinus]